MDSGICDSVHVDIDMDIDMDSGICESVHVKLIWTVVYVIVCI